MEEKIILLVEDNLDDEALTLRALVNYRDYHATTRGDGSAMEVAPVAQGLRVRAFDGAAALLLLAPGAIQTPINRAAWETPHALQSLLTLIPYGRIGVPEDIGQAAVWLASDAADYVHGQTIFVDGGMTLYPEFARGG